MNENLYRTPQEAPRVAHGLTPRTWLKIWAIIGIVAAVVGALVGWAWERTALARQVLKTERELIKSINDERDKNR
jgi:uncharacterized membrane protein YagU involved in acid resistance